MSIENNLASIAKSLEIIALALTNKTTPVASVAQSVVPVTKTAPVAPVVVAPVAPVVVAPVAPAVVPATPVDPLVPTDPKSFVTYVMATYKTLGASGMGIEPILVGAGYKNINEVRAADYEKLYNAIEALK